MGSLTDNVPKPLLEVAGKTLLENELDILPESVDEAIIVVGYLGDKIKQRLGEEYEGKRLTYVVQDVLDGTAGALWRAAPLLKDRFMVLMSDDMYSKDDANRCLINSDWVMQVHEAPVFSGGRMILAEDGTIDRIDEGFHGGKPGIIGTSMYVLDTRLFDYAMVPKSEGSNEFGLPQTVLAASKKSGISITIEPATFWLQISDASDLAKAEAVIASR